MRKPTIRQARDTRQAAAKLYYETQARWKSDEDNAKTADAHIKAWRTWQEAHEQYERARRRANWRRAERIILLASHGRGQAWASKFVAGGFELIR